ncbi:MAG: hypothetical protein QOI78_2759, partial [Actinomycetota bacterium]|nr:hypothetical protein [Actinomycetota bacterium]
MPTLAATGVAARGTNGRSQA